MVHPCFAVSCAILTTSLCATCIFAQPASSASAPDKSSPFFDSTDGAFDISGFLSTRTGFLPVVVPITEPAVGFGLGGGLAFFHSKPLVRPGPEGEPPRVVMPSTTLIAGAATENGTWLGGLGHLGMWNEGRIRYVGGGGYGSINLDWYGRDDALNGHSISYTNKVFAFLQRITFQIGETDFFIGPQYRFLSTNSEFGFSNLNLDILPNEFQSKTSAAGLNLGYDSRDQPFSPTRGINANVSYWQNATWLGGDFDYWTVNGYWLQYFPLAPNWVLGVHLDGTFTDGEVPFYDLPFINMRGIPSARFVDRVVAQMEVELRWDITRRWSILGFGGVGRVGEDFSDLLDAESHFGAGMGFRYLIAREYGLRMGVDIAYGEDGPAVYVSVGTGWVRP